MLQTGWWKSSWRLTWFSYGPYSERTPVHVRLGRSRLFWRGELKHLWSCDSFPVSSSCTQRGHLQGAPGAVLACPSPSMWAFGEWTSGDDTCLCHCLKWKKKNLFLEHSDSVISSPKRREHIWILNFKIARIVQRTPRMILLRFSVYILCLTILLFRNFL